MDGLEVMLKNSILIVHQEVVFQEILWGDLVAQACMLILGHLQVAVTIAIRQILATVLGVEEVETEVVEMERSQVAHFRHQESAQCVSVHLVQPAHQANIAILMETVVAVQKRSPVLVLMVMD
jgi:hypothetical protein